MTAQFAQENATYEGTGQGLSKAKKLIELMGGSIEFRSEKNKSTTLTALLPAVARKMIPKPPLSVHVYDRGGLC